MATVERKTRSAALPARLYRDPEVLELERERIFERTWQLAAHASQLPGPGTYMTTKVGTQPVLVIRDEEGEVRAFRNVCRHRGSRLLKGSGECGKAIRCLYHGWTYRTRRRADRRAGGAQHPRPRQVRARALPGARGDRRGPRVREPRHARHAAGRADRRTARAHGPVRDRAARAAHALRRHPAGQLEDHGRQLPRGLPRADRPPRAHAAARLQALRRGGARQLGLVRGAAARQAVGQQDGAALPAPGLAHARPRRGRPARVALRVHLPEHRHRPLSRPRLDLEDRCRRRADHARHGAALPPPRRVAAHAAGAARELQGEHGGGQRGPRPGAERAGGHRDARLGAGPAVGREAAVAWFADKIRADLGEDA